MHLARQPRLIRLGAVGAVHPHIAARVILGHDPDAAFITRRCGLPYVTAQLRIKDVAAVDGNMGLLAEAWDSDHRQRRPIRGGTRTLPPTFSVQRAFLSFWTVLLCSSGYMSSAVLPVLITVFSSSVFRHFWAGTKEAHLFLKLTDPIA